MAEDLDMMNQLRRTSKGILRQAFGERLEENTLELLLDAATFHEYPAGTMIIKEGEFGSTFYVIVEGTITTTKQVEDGSERVLSILKPGQYFGELALIDDAPRMATCTATTDVVLLEFNEDVFDRLVVHSPALANAILRRILGDFRSMDKRTIADLNAKNSELARAYQELKNAQKELVEKERLERELELAAEAQRNLLPWELPQYPSYHFAAYQQPARVVGGDFYDVIHLDDDHVGLLLADVADKGMHAALIMAVTRTLFYREAQQTLSPAQVAIAVHQGMLAVAPHHDVFVTAFYGVLHLPTGQLTYVRAAQEKPLLIRPDQGVMKLPGEGRFLGMLPELELAEYSIGLVPGDRLLLFSDGLPDAVNNEDIAYGNKRLVKALSQAASLPANGLTEYIVSDVANWTSGADAFDDLTLLAIEVTK